MPGTHVYLTETQKKKMNVIEKRGKSLQFLSAIQRMTVFFLSFIPFKFSHFFRVKHHFFSARLCFLLSHLFNTSFMRHAQCKNGAKKNFSEKRFWFRTNVKTRLSTSFFIPNKSWSQLNFTLFSIEKEKKNENYAFLCSTEDFFSKKHQNRKETRYDHVIKYPIWSKNFIRFPVISIVLSSSVHCNTFNP